MDKLSKLSIIFVVLIIANITYVTYSLEIRDMSVKATIVIKDALDREVELSNPIHRVVSLSPSTTEIIFALNKQNVLVGVDAVSYDDPHYNISSYARERGIENVGGYWWSLVNIEAIVRLNPDLVFADKGAHQQLLNTFEDLGLKVIYLNGGASREISDIYRDIELIGTVLNCSLEASQLISRIEDEFDYYSKYIESNMYSVKYLFIIYINGGIWVSGKSTFIDDALGKLGLVNVVDKDGWILLSLEELYSLTPDIIFFTTMNENDVENVLRKIDEYELRKITHRLVVFKPQESDSFLRPGPLVINIPRAIYIVLESHGLRKPPPVNEFKYTPIIYLTLIMIIMIAIMVRKN